MPITEKDWHDLPTEDTPINRLALRDMEKRLGAYSDSVVAAEATRAEAAEALLAPLASPALTGVPKAPTATLGTATTQVATTAFVQNAVGAASVLNFIGQNTAAGEGAMEQFGAMGTAERAVHSSNTAFGWHAGQALNGTNGTFNITSTTAIGGESLNLTGVEAKAGPIYAGGTSNTPMVVFKKLTAGVTNPVVNQAYYVVGGTANAFKVSLTHGGAAIVVAGHAVEADTEVVLMTSTEDNTLIGSQAGKSLTTGGGNTFVGENAGVNYTTGEESVAIGCEALGINKAVNNIIGIGFRAWYQNKTGSGTTAIGNQVLEENDGASEAVFIGHKAGQKITTGGNKSVAIGFECMIKGTGASNTVVGTNAFKSATTASSNTIMGAFAGEKLTEGSENTIMGLFAGPALTTGARNVVMGMEALKSGTTAERNTILGYSAGEVLTGKENVFLGYKAGQTKTAVDKTLIIANNPTLALVEGVMSATAGEQTLGLYGVTPTKRASAIGSPAETLPALKTAVDAIRVAIQKIGITE